MSNSDIGDPKNRFTDRVESYQKYRPRYPKELLELFRRELFLEPRDIIADIGSGTGLSSELFLQNGNMVYAVEPNEKMRFTAEAVLSGYSNFKSLSGSAEATGLEDKSVDYIIAAQAFHWFERIAARQEFRRILKRGGYIVLIWYDRRTSGSGISEAYETLLQTYSIDYNQVNHRNVDPNRLQQFLGNYAKRVFPYTQVLNFEGFLGRLISSSYMPNTNHPKFEELKFQAKKCFDKFQVDGQVAIEYDIRVYFTQLKR